MSDNLMHRLRYPANAFLVNEVTMEEAAAEIIRLRALCARQSETISVSEMRHGRILVGLERRNARQRRTLAKLYQRRHHRNALITRLRAKVDAVYSERNRLAAAFARMAFAAGFKAGKGVDPDETKWPVVYVDTPNGQVSWHIAEADQGVLEGLPQYNGEWDGKFTARDPAWSVWPAADLVATARRDAMEQAALKSRITELEAENAGLSANECLHDIHGDESGNLYCPRIAELEAALQDIASGRYSNVLLPTHPPQDPAVVRARAALEGKKE